LDDFVRYTEAPARRDELLRRLTAEGYVASARLAEHFGVSEMTVRRDLRQLAIAGRARRVVGGASLPGFGSFGLPFDERDRSGSAEKRAIAAACLPLLDDVTTMGIDAGTTTASLARLIAPGTTVVSHSVPVILSCTARDDIDLIALGGSYQRDTKSFTGGAARQGLTSLSIDVAVLSATAIDKTGVLCANTLDAELKQGMAAIANRTILLVDHTKLGARAPIRFGTLDLIDTIVTDDRADEDSIRMLTTAGITVVVASVERHEVPS